MATVCYRDGKGAEKDIWESIVWAGDTVCRPVMPGDGLISQYYYKLQIPQIG